MPQARKYRHWVQICAPVDDINSRGGNDITYDTDNPPGCYAAIEPLVGRELIFAQQIRPDLTHKITLRYTSELNHRSMLRWFNGTRYIEFNCGPPVDFENRQVEQSVYANQI